MVFKLEGELSDRDSWEAHDRCSLGRAMEVIGTRSAILLLREAFYGTTRFDDFARRVGITDAVASARLKQLVEEGLLEKSPYRTPGQRTRYEYVLTQMGRDLLPMLVTMMQWGDKYLQDNGGPLHIVDGGTGSPISVHLVSESGAEANADDLHLRFNRDSTTPRRP